MNVLVICQNAGNKGDRAVLVFMVRELARNGVAQVTVSTTRPRWWRDYRDLKGINVQFAPQAWFQFFDRPPGLFGKITRRLRYIFYRRVVYWIVQRALLGGWGGTCCRWLTRVFYRRFLTAAREADFVLCAGGHHLTTILSKDVVCWQACDMSVALLSGKPLVLWSQSIGPFQFHSERNARQIKKIVLGATRVYIRDEGSAAELARLGVPPESVFLTCDSGFGLCDFVGDLAQVPPTRREPILGIAVYHAAHVDREVYVGAFASLARHAVSLGYRLRFFPMEITGGDAPIIRAIVERCGHPEACSVLDSSQVVSEHRRSMVECAMFIGHKTHSVIFALSSAVPVVAIAYHQKTRDFMSQFGLSDYCIDDAQLSEQRLIEVFDAVHSRRDAIHAQQLRISEEMDRKVKKDLADIIAHMPQIQEVRPSCRE
jgi:colanic acid/amylovoran biosynthesis protein